MRLALVHHLAELPPDEPVVGFWGAPPRAALAAAAERHQARLVDLDVDYGAPTSRLVPTASCHIIRNCIDNAVALGPRLRALVAAVGREKCDAARCAARLLADVLEAPIETVTNEALPEAAPLLLCEAQGSLKQRVVRLMRAIVEPLDDAEEQAARASRCAATHGFWGTPPFPIALLDLFPTTTHIFGWTRCVEAGRPADLTLETHVPDGLPIVFFSQGFCHKAALARHLATRHGGLHVDVHDSISEATRAKVEAFLRLSVPGGRP